MALFSEFLALIEDGHTYLDVYDISDSNFFPLRINNRDRQVFITNKNGKNNNLAGKQIISINNEKTEDLLKKMLKLQAMDNGNISGKEGRISDNFNYLYYLIYGNCEEYLIKIKDSNEKVENIKIKGVSSWYLSDNTANTSIKTKTIGDTMILIYDFPSFENKLEFENKIENFFRDVKEQNVNNLIIDNSNNLGGFISNQNYFLKRLSEESFLFDNIYLTMGRNSYSAGELITKEIKILIPKVKTIGEPTSGGLDYANSNTIILNNSGIKINISTLKYISDIESKKGISKPDINIEINPKLEAMGVNQALEKAMELIKKKN